MELFGIDQRMFEIFMLVLARISMIVSVIPIFGSANVPIPVKVGLSVFLTLISYSFAEASGVPHDLSIAALFTLMLREALIGMLFGFITGILFYAIQFAGHFISFQMGFAMVQVIDPQSQERVPIIGQFYFILSILLFLLINGHHLVLNVLVESFSIVPIGTGVLSRELTGSLTLIGGRVFVLAIKIASPILVTLFLTDVMMGIIARTVPQMNVFFVSLPLKIGLGLTLLVMTLSSFPWLIEKLVVEMSENLNMVLRML
ncbi:MAG: flagellar type III secretion system protein FliR [Candidatus Marinimicrobia bacterium]|nr:flagellar type III secretion system protein FliR [Candidatus Neomarinimicrobiota bacterium]